MRTLRPKGGAPAALDDPRAASAGHVVDRLAHVLLPGLFLLFVWFWHPFHSVFEFDPDEGNEVIKALLVAQGHPLYAETYSDQPPVFTYMLRCWFGVTGWSVHGGRLMILLCSAILLWALYQTVRVSWGRAAGLATAFLLTTSYRYLALSVAVMQAVPTLMFAVLSIYALSRYRHKPHAAWVVASGAFLTLSLLTKMITAPVAVLIFAALVHTAWVTWRGSDRRRRWLSAVVMWCVGAAAAGVIVILVAIPLGEFMQFIKPHLTAQETMAVEGFDQVYVNMVKADSAFAFLGLVGLVQVVRRREWFSLLAAVWCLMSYGLLWRHRPLWYHHYPLLGIPLCWMAGIGVGALFSSDLWRACLPWRGPKSAGAMLVLLITLCVGVAAAAGVPSKFERERAYAAGYVRMTRGDEYTVAVLKQFKDRTEYVVTDRQMLAFSAGMMVPPELSVTSVKRVRSGELTISRLIDLLETYNPGAIHLSWRKRIPLTQELSDYVKGRYRPLYADFRGDRCFMLTSLDVDPAAILQSASAEVPESAEGHYNLGVYLAGVGHDEEAVRALQRSIVIRPSMYAYDAMARGLKRLGRYAEAAEAYETVARNLQRQKQEKAAAEVREEARRLRALDSR
ncbi:MAG: glycosyltransferase family 39 protein [Phycisphaerales bacterium]|nr:MAG: glycosyltransferase family 39 protein [Phycisphaerales bacterium]